MRRQLSQHKKPFYQLQGGFAELLTINIPHS